MKKDIRLLLLGLLPGAVGYLVNVFVMFIPTSLFSLSQFLFLILWCVLSAALYQEGESLLRHTLLLHAVSLFWLLMSLVQAAGGGFYDNLIGGLTQCALSAMLLPGFLISSALGIEAIWPSHIFEVALMVLSSLLGCFLRIRRERLD